MQSVGRMHPLVLHFPIVMIMLLTGVWCTKSILRLPSMNIVFDLLFGWTVCFALLSSILGLFISKEGGYDDQSLFNHKYLTIGFSFLLFALWWLYQSNVRASIISAGLIVSIAMIVLGTHFGAELTHGKGFVLHPAVDR
jgi:hypothetical protein